MPALPQSFAFRRGAVPAAGVFAQPPPAANPNASTPAIANPKASNPNAPAAGAHSFTEAQAKSRIQGAGYSNVCGLVIDKDGIWRGKASKGSAAVNVALDYQGNVAAK